MATQKPDENKNPFNLEDKTKFFFGGANTDETRELLGAEDKGQYIDALNVRVNDTSGGSDKSAKSIGGEELFNSSSGDGYKCILATNVGSKQVEMWAPYNPADGGIIRIDGDIMCQSADFAITPDNLLQWDTNNDAIGGEIYITDFVLKPMYFSIKDIIDNFGITQKYFADFNINEYIISLQLPPDNLIYDTSPLVSVGTGGGLPTGQYSYSHRFASTSGDRTNWSVPTPLIFVPYLYQSPNMAEPFIGLKTVGNDADTASPGQFGVKLLFRVNNVYNYEFIEIRRTAFNNAEAIDYVPPSYIVKRISLPLNQTNVQIFEYIDSTANQSDQLVVAQADSQDFLSEIKRAKAIRYFFNKVILGNIEYESRDITNKVTFLESVNGNTMCPILENIGSEGYKNPYTHAYKRMYMHLERYGFSLIAWDSNFSRTLAVEIPGFAAYTMPSKRDAMSSVLGGDSLFYTKTSSHQATTAGNVDETFEIVDYKLGATRNLPSDIGSQYGGRNILTGHSSTGNVQVEKANVKSGQVGYKPFYPQAPYDLQSNLRYTPIESVSTQGLDNITPPDNGQPQDFPATYNPYIFDPQYNALGMCLVGVDTIPDWATAFSVVRTKKAGRVVAQGMAFYSLVNSTRWNQAGAGGYKRAGTKRTNRVVVQFPDIENGVVGESILQDLELNPTSYRIQMVEPLGFNSEPLGFRSCSLNNPSRPAGGGLVSAGHADTQVDMLVHASCQSELSAGSSYGERRVVGSDADNDADETGIQDAGEPANTTGYVAFGIWRNQPNGAPSVGGQPFNINGNFQFTVTGLNKIGQEEGLILYELELDVDVYLEEGNTDNPFIGDVENFYSDQTKNWQEPVYICNLLRDGATVQNLDIQNLLPTGNYVKIKSLIGYSDGLANQVFVLCGERTEDVGKPDISSIDKYVWVEMNNDTEFFRWIDISFLTAPQIALIDGDIVNGTTNYNGLRLYGTYTCDPSNNYNVQFGSTYIPPIGAQIQVRYDNRNPVYIFGGDTFVGYANFPVVHASTNTASGTGDQPGDGNNYGSMLKLQRGMPYLWYKMRRNYYIIKNSYPAGGGLLPVIQACDTLQPSTAGTDWCKISAIRQMVVLYNCQSYSHLPLSYHKSYPIVNYIMRPTKWNDNKTVTQNNIDAQYETDYPGEKDRWRLGGIQIQQFSPNILNLDYSKENVTDRYNKVSSLIFVENTWFPTRITWSYSRPIQRILAPNLKSFAPLSIFDLSDARGQIQRLYTFKQQGENLYAGCEDDWCMALTRKRTLTDLNGDSLGVTGNGQDTAFIQEQIWMDEISKGGLKGDFWKTFAENGDEAFYANYNGVFKLVRAANGGAIQEITDGYFYQLYKSLCLRVQRPDIKFLAQELYATYNTKDEEYWIRFKTQIIDVELVIPSTDITVFDKIYGTSTPHYSIVSATNNDSIVELIPFGTDIATVLFKVTDATSTSVIFNVGGNLLFTALDGEWWEVTYNLSSGSIWSAKKVDKELNEQRDTFLFSYSNRGESGKWLGVFDYDFDTFNSFDNKVFGQRNRDTLLETFSLGDGVFINGEKLNMRVFATMNPQIQQSYIFERARVNSNEKADIKTYGVNDMSVSIATLQQANLKNYHAFENYVPRDTVARDKNSNTHILYQIYKQLTDKQFFVNSITFFYNKIR